MAPIPGRDTNAPNHGYTDKQRDSALWALVSIISAVLVVVVAIMVWSAYKSKFEETREKMKRVSWNWNWNWNWKRAKKVDKGKMPEVPAPAHLAGSDDDVPDVAQVERTSEELSWWKMSGMIGA